MISTKSMTGSYGNMKNRWEEFVGDLRNLRGRHPLAVLGVLVMADQCARGLTSPQRRRVLLQPFRHLELK